MRWIFLILVFAFQAQAAEKAYTLKLEPLAGYSNFNGFALGLNTALLVPVWESWQWEFGGAFYVHKHTTNFELSSGLIYNFSPDWSRSFYAGGGMGYGNDYQLGERNYKDNRKVYGYAEAGKRFRLNDSGTFMWTPNLKIESSSMKHGTLILTPLSFGWSF